MGSVARCYPEVAPEASHTPAPTQGARPESPPRSMGQPGGDPVSPRSAQKSGSEKNGPSMSATLPTAKLPRGAGAKALSSGCAARPPHAVRRHTDVLQSYAVHLYERRREPIAQRGPCIACEGTTRRVASATGDCPYLLCHDCATARMDAGAWCVCGAAFTEDEVWEEGGDDSLQGARGRVGPVPCPPCGKTSLQS